MDEEKKLSRTRRKRADIAKKFLIKEGPDEKVNLPRSKTKTLLIAAILAIIIGLIGASGYFYYKFKAAIKNSSAVAKSETKSYADKIGEFMLLPDNEEPTLATVTDKEKLTGQPFFANAQNGDKVLIYAKNEKAILYRPSNGKIIEVSMISGKGENVPSVPATEAQTQGNETSSRANKEGDLTVPAESNQSSGEVPAKITIYNGGRISGLAQKIADNLSRIADIEVVEKTNADGSYKKTIVIDFSGKYIELAQKIAETIGGEIGTMPEGEIKPEADILIIGGSDFKTN